MLHCWDLHLQLPLPPLLPALGHRPGLGGHQGARALLHSGLVDQLELAALQGAHQLLPGLQLVPEDEGKGCVTLIWRVNSKSDLYIDQDKNVYISHLQ